MKTSEIPNNKPSEKKLIIEEITSEWKDVPTEFNARKIFQRVINKVILKYNYVPYQDTIMRYFRELNQDPNSEIKYECLNRQKSLYRKVKIEKI